MTRSFVTPSEIRSRFSAAMSDMYRREVPQYGALLELVAEVNKNFRLRPSAFSEAGDSGDGRLAAERHGAIRVGKPEELRTLRRLFAVMGMKPVGYYDLSTAGVPVHSTAFRPTEATELAENPFRVFTSLLRLELIADPELRNTASAILRRRDIFTPKLRELIATCELVGGLTSEEADQFIVEALQTFRWHSESTVTQAEYRQLHDAHRLVADVVCFKGPHINHLTPRTLDIDAIQALMAQRGMSPKELVEGPPRRDIPILLRQTSFKALEEAIEFKHGSSASELGTHTARFGEVEQRGIALTERGRRLYDKLLAKVRTLDDVEPSGSYQHRLEQVFLEFPDDLTEIRRQGLGYFRYQVTTKGKAAWELGERAPDIEAVLAKGWVHALPITYEDFLPVSAAGIFQSNLGDEQRKHYVASQARSAFEAALGCSAIDEFSLYEAEQAASLEAVSEFFAIGVAA